MMYHNKLVCCVKANGKILREFSNQQIKIPFGTEYSLLIKNLNDVRVSVTISIDGSNISEGSSFIVNAKDEVELTRFIKNGNLKAGNKFKFIERTKSIEDHRGIKAEDGLIVVEYQYEQTGFTHPLFYDHTYEYSKQTILGPSKLYRGISASEITCCASPVANTQQYNAGITVPGSISDQSFTVINDFVKQLEKHTMVLHLIGDDGIAEITKPITVNTKQTCTTCGRKNKMTNKFCSNCGTSLQIV